VPWPQRAINSGNLRLWSIKTIVVRIAIVIGIITIVIGYIGI
jgi:hypothetical protein